MEISKETRRLLLLRDFIIPNTWRYLLKSLWLFFPPILFLVISIFTFWHAVQGKDIMAITLQYPPVDDHNIISLKYACFILALVFWVYVTWYSTRLVSKAKNFQDPVDNRIWEIFRVQIPRLLAFTCFTIVLLAIARLPHIVFARHAPPNQPPYSNAVLDPILPLWACRVLLYASFPLYFFTYKFWNRFLEKKEAAQPGWISFLSRVRRATYLFFILGFIAVIFIQNPLVLIIYIFSLQIGLVLLMILRRELDEAKNAALGIGKDYNPHHVSKRSSSFMKLRHIVLDDEDRSYFRGFKWISLVAFLIYLAAIKSIWFATEIGSFPFMLLAFGVLLGIGNFISFISVLRGFNFHFVLFCTALVFGHCNDPYIATINKTPVAKFNNRKNLREYFSDWLNDPGRRDGLNAVLKDSTGKQKYPVYFIMANGGASRSGFWTASILTGLESTSEGKFSRHLFCLSGASGGSVGTSTFFSLLRAKKNIADWTLFTEASEKYLKSDFLTFTIAHLLGPDIFQHFIPFKNNITKDRATALAYALEKAPGKHRFLYDSFAVAFSSLITQKNMYYNLPVLCINTTCMQNGSPAVISNIKISQDSIQNNYFNNRIDVLSILPDNRDIKLSNAVVLGASFPYLSPAGRIDGKLCDTCEDGSNYFVDGGYFDNSGAGVVNEMIIALNNLLNDDPEFSKYRDKLEFFVTHISNTDPKNRKFHVINPMINDLLAPVKTIMGSYGTQTMVNDQRLKNYLYFLYKDFDHYRNIELYKDTTHIRYSMNWVISDYQLKSMNKNLQNNPVYLQEAIKMKNWPY